MTLDSTDPVLLARTQTLSDIPRRSARRFPHKAAIIDGDTTLTFAELDRVVDGTAAAMQAAGIERGDRVALLSHNCWQFPVLGFAAARIGAVLVPVNFMLGADEIGWILDHSGSQTFIVEGALTATADAALASGGGAVRRRLSIHNDGSSPGDGWTDLATWTDGTGTPSPVHVGDDDPVRMMYTSGTESRPKGALLTSRALMWQYVSVALDGQMTSAGTDLHTLPLYHCAQFDCFLNPDLYLGATSIILPGPDAATVLRTIAEKRVTKFFAPPTVWISLLRHPDFDSTDLSSLEQGYYGAAAMPVEVLKEITERVPQLRLWNFYGQTEMSPLATILGPDEQVSGAGSAGRPGLNVQTAVVDAFNQEVPVGEVGEIVHRSPHATLGYFNDPERTAEAFAGGWFHSGDLGRFDENGLLWVVDRKKDMIKTGGENVASREVEEALYAMPGIAEVAVFAVSHPTWIEAVAAVVVPAPGASLTSDDVIAFAKSHLAGYKAPKYVVVADSLPKNPSGKILKKELRVTHADLAASEG